MSRFSVNALKHFLEAELVIYAQLAKESQEILPMKEKYSDSDSDELVVLDPLEVNWLESSDEYVVNRGDYIIVDGLTELEADILLDELQAECNE